MPESTASRYKTPLTLFLAALLIAIPVGLLARQGQGGGQRGPGAAAPAGPGAPPAAGGAAAAPAGGQGRGGGAPAAAAGARGAAPVDLTGYWVSIVTEDWIERMSPDSPRSGVGRGGGGGGGGGGGRGAGAGAGGARGGVGAAPTATDPCRVYAAGGSLRVPGRLNITWADDNTLKVDLDAGTQTRLLHFNATVPPGTPKSLQGYSVATWETGGRGGGFGGGGGGRGGAAPAAPRWGSLKVVTTNLSGGYLLSSRDTYSDNAVLTENFTRHSDFGMDYFTVTAVIEDGGNPRVTSSTFKKEPNGSKFAPTGCEIVK
jgi:hypothetical protein